MKHSMIVFGIMLLAFLMATPMYAEKKKENLFPFEQEEEKVAEEYAFSTTWRIEAGYVQDWQNSNTETTTYPDTYLHGAKLGFTVDFNLPYHLSVQTGLAYSFSANKNDQHWRTVSKENNQPEYLEHFLMKHTVTLPVHAVYEQKLWKELAMFFYTGPNFQVGILQQDKITPEVSAETLAWLQQTGVPTESYDRYSSGELSRFNMQWSLGGGFQWAKYRVQAGYDFGLTNIVKNYPLNHPVDAKAREWGWFVSFSYAF